VFASDELAVVKRAAARDLKKIPRPNDDDFVASGSLHRSRNPPGASFDNVDGTVEIILFAALSEGPADTSGYC
jgi:hypothetical protein